MTCTIMHSSGSLKFEFTGRIAVRVAVWHIRRAGVGFHTGEREPILDLWLGSEPKRLVGLGHVPILDQVLVAPYLRKDSRQAKHTKGLNAHKRAQCMDNFPRTELNHPQAPG